MGVRCQGCAHSEYLFGERLKGKKKLNTINFE